jgi:DNA-binding beta-propeller fold protein YncE
MVMHFARLTVIVVLLAARFQAQTPQKSTPADRVAHMHDALYVSNYKANTITVYDAKTGALLGTAVKAGRELKGMNGFDIAPDGSFYVAGQDSNNVVHYDKRGKLLGILDPDNAAGISAPQGVVFGPDGMLYVASMNNGKVVRYNTATKAFESLFVRVEFPGAGQSQPIEPHFDSEGNLTVSTFKGGRIVKYHGPLHETPDTANGRKSSPTPGTLMLTFQSPTETSRPSEDAKGLAVAKTAYACAATLPATLTRINSLTAKASSGRRVLIEAINPTTMTGEIQEFLEDGTFVSRLIPNGAEGLALPGGISIGPDEKLYIANIRVDGNFNDTGSEIVRFDPISGKSLGVFVRQGNGLNVPFAMRFGSR